MGVVTLVSEPGRDWPSQEPLQPARDSAAAARLDSQGGPSAAVRSQLAVVRALADQVDCIARSGEDGLRDQLIEELARLGCRLLEQAGSLAGPAHGEESGIFSRTPWSRPAE